MRFLISNSMKSWGGGENWSLTTARGLAERGHRVTIACQPDGELFKRSSELGNELTVVPLSLRGDFNPVAVFRMRTLFRREKIQLVCCNMDREVRSLGVAARLAGNVVFVRRRGSDYAFKNRLRYKLTYKYLVDRVLVNSESTRRTILHTNNWMPAWKVDRIYNGIPIESFFPSQDLRDRTRMELGYNHTSFVIGMAGTLLPRKKHITLIRAASLLVNKIPELRLLFLGHARDQAHLDMLKNTAVELGVEGIIRFQGPVREINRFYNSMDVLVMPSDNEGFGYVAAEAMAAGVPVIVSDATSLPEVVGPEGKAGLIFPLDNQRELSYRLYELYQSPDLRNRLGSAGRKRVLEKFSLERMISEVEKFFESLLSEN